MQLDRGAVDQIAQSYHGYYRVASKGGPGSIITYNNDVQDGGSSVEIDCAKAIVVVRLKVAHRSSGKTELTKDNVDYNTLHQVFRDPQYCFVEGLPRPRRPSVQQSEDSGGVSWSLTPYQEPQSQSGSSRGEEEDTRRVRAPARLCHVQVMQERSNVLERLQPRHEFLQERLNPGTARNIVRKVSVAIKDRVTKDCVSHSETICDRDNCVVAPSGPTLPTGKHPVVCSGHICDDGDRFVMRQKTGGLPCGQRPERMAGRWFKEVPQRLEGEEEGFVAAPTKAVENFRKRKQELAPERVAKKALSSHKDNLECFNDLMQRQPVHFEQRKINWFKF